MDAVHHTARYSIPGRPEISLLARSHPATIAAISFVIDFRWAHQNPGWRPSAETIM